MFQNTSLYFTLIADKWYWKILSREKTFSDLQFQNDLGFCLWHNLQKGAKADKQRLIKIVQEMVMI